tara:strand:- start:1638 stop:1991 length:354 start_codon:yes stop_codon:yes gene_type:complete
MEKVLKKLTKKHPNWYKKIRRILFNLYRPILHDKSKSIFNQHLIAYIMFGLFTWSAILLYNDVPNHYVPFISGWILIPITWIYFKFSPQTWDEMYDYEKEAFRLIWKLPHNWDPKKD